MTSLAAQQQALLAALFAWPAEPAARDLIALARGDCRRGLMAYQANGHVMAERSLSAAYPVLRELLGEQSLRALACALWHAQPPWRGDLAQWGGGLSGFVRDSDQLAELPYLSDVAAVEWALHQAAGAVDQSADHASLALLMSADPTRLALQLVPGCTVLPSLWPVVSVVGAHRDQSPSFDALRARLRARVPETAVVWRAGLQVCLREGLAHEGVFLATLQAGQSLSVALDAASLLDFNVWLPMAVRTGLLLGAAVWPFTS